MNNVDYKKIQKFLFVLATRANLLGFNSNNFTSVSGLQTASNKAEVGEEYTSEYMSLYLYEKYKWVSNVFSSGHWELIQVFLSRHANLDYEKKSEEKLVSTPYEAITEEQYQILLEYNKKNNKGTRGL